MVTFHSWGYPLPHPPHTPITHLQKGEGGGRFEFSKFSKKWEGSDFSHKMGRVGKIWGGRGGVVLKKAGYHLYLIFKQAFSNAIFCSVCETCGCVSFFAHLNDFYLVFHRLTESNQQLWDF